MKELLAIILFLFPLTVNSQTKAIYNKMDFDYHGKVESVLIESFKPIIREGNIVDYRYEGGIFGIGSQKIFFNQDGTVDKKYEYKTLCGGDSIEIDQIWTYHYTESKIDSVIRAEADTLESRRKGSRPWKFFYNHVADSVYYETSNLLTSRTSRISYENNKRTREYLDRDSVTTLVEINTYDEYDRHIKFEVIKQNELSEVSILYYPDSLSHNATLSNRIKLSNNQVWRTEYELNDKGDIIKTTKYKPDGNYWTHWSFKYEYDDYGNWIRKEKYNYEDRMLNLYKQTINYASSR